MPPSPPRTSDGRGIHSVGGSCSFSLPPSLSPPRGATPAGLIGDLAPLIADSRIYKYANYAPVSAHRDLISAVAATPEENVGEARDHFRLTNTSEDRQTDRRTDRQTDRQAYRRTSGQMGARRTGRRTQKFSSN